MSTIQGYTGGLLLELIAKSGNVFSSSLLKYNVFIQSYFTIIVLTGWFYNDE